MSCDLLFLIFCQFSTSFVFNLFLNFESIRSILISGMYVKQTIYFPVICLLSKSFFAAFAASQKGQKRKGEPFLIVLNNCQKFSQLLAQSQAMDKHKASPNRHFIGDFDCSFSAFYASCSN